jgi:transcriptional antiterminator RfaH
VPGINLKGMIVDKVSHWYAVYLRSRYEQKTNAELRKKGIESFLPLIEVTRIWSDRKKKITEPLFRGYLFVNTDLTNKIEILRTIGVVRLVGIGEIPSPIPEKQINWIRILVNYPAIIRRETFFTVGKKVRVIAGPFNGLEGFILKLKDMTRVVVSIDSIVQSVSVEIPIEMLQEK